MPTTDYADYKHLTKHFTNMLHLLPMVGVVVLARSPVPEGACPSRDNQHLLLFVPCLFFFPWSLLDLN